MATLNERARIAFIEHVAADRGADIALRLLLKAEAIRESVVRSLQAAEGWTRRKRNRWNGWRCSTDDAAIRCAGRQAPLLRHRILASLKDGRPGHWPGTANRISNRAGITDEKIPSQIRIHIPEMAPRFNPQLNNAFAV